MNADPIIDTDVAWSSVCDKLLNNTSSMIKIDGLGVWHCSHPLSDDAVQLLDLYSPLVGGPKSSKLVVAHLGQSLDGFIATASGDSHYVTGTENIIHLHRMRALFDAVIVGANTVRHDDPQLTTRHVPGANPVRVVIDPRRRLQSQHALFRDPSARTLVLCASSAKNNHSRMGNHVEIVVVPSKTQNLPASACIDALCTLGLKRLFIEGGGDTVSRFVRAGAVDRLQITIAPVLFGAGQPGLRLRAATKANKAFRPNSRQFRLGNDILFDCTLSEHVL